MTAQYVLYRPEVETISEEENQVIDDILASMKRLDGRTHEAYGHHVRVLMRKVTVWPWAN